MWMFTAFVMGSFSIFRVVTGNRQARKKGFGVIWVLMKQSAFIELDLMQSSPSKKEADLAS